MKKAAQSKKLLKKKKLARQKQGRKKQPEQQNHRKAVRRILRIVAWVGAALGVALLALAAWLLRPPAPPQESTSVAPLPVSSAAATVDSSLLDEVYLPDKLLITAERKTYQSGQMVLKIPCMGVDKAVQNGTQPEQLQQGPSLYDYAQLPGEGNRNVSIVAHRDIEGAEFYFANKLGRGDRFYLVYDDTIYQYEYEKTYIVRPEDWSPIYLQGYSCLTLTTCNPLGSTRERLIVVAKLTATQPYTKEYRYLPWAQGITKPYAWERAAKSWDAAPLASAPVQDSAIASSTDSATQSSAVSLPGEIPE